MTWAALGGIGPYFELGELSPTGDDVGGRSEPSEGWRPLTELLGDVGWLTGAVGRHATRLGTDDVTIAASIFQQGWAARLTSVLIGAEALGLPLPDLSASNLGCWFPEQGPARLAVVSPRPLDRDEAWRRACAQHLRLLHEGLRRVADIGDRLLWGNVAAACAGSLTELTRARVVDAGQLRDLDASLPADLGGWSRSELGSWESTGAGPRFRRTTCCLYERVPGGGRCGDCSLDRSR